MAEFKKWLDQQAYETKLQSASPYTDALANLTEVANGLGTLMRKHHIDVVLDAGGAVNMGQQYRLKLKLQSRDREYILFRAYLASTGTISFDFYDEKVTVCDGTKSADVFSTVGAFLERPATIGTIQQLVRQAKTPLDKLYDRMHGGKAKNASTSKPRKGAARK